MKKKIKDLTLGEWNKICKKFLRFNCSNCPCHIPPCGCYHPRTPKHYYEKHFLEKEVEVDDN